MKYIHGRKNMKLLQQITPYLFAYVITMFERQNGHVGKCVAKCVPIKRCIWNTRRVFFFIWQFCQIVKSLQKKNLNSQNGILTLLLQFLSSTLLSKNIVQIFIYFANFPFGCEESYLIVPFPKTF